VLSKAGFTMPWLHRSPRKTAIAVLHSHRAVRPLNAPWLDWTAARMGRVKVTLGSAAAASRNISKPTLKFSLTFF
jgi:hypothetical protein